MVAMALWATDLRQITGNIGSQIRMDIYAKAGDKMAIFYYQQKLAGTDANDIDIIDLDYTGPDAATRKAASHKVKILGKTKNYPRVTGHSDVKFMTNGKNVVSCKLTFLKSTEKSEFLASVHTSVDEIVTFAFVGALESGMYSRPIPGTLTLVAGKWSNQIDL